jgi:single-strand DNA-binding protein
MAEGLNRVMLIGNLGQDPELKFTQGGQAILKMRIATTESYMGRDNERKQSTEWHSVTMWGKRAESLSKFLSKGRTIYVEGRIQTRQWEDKEGKKRYNTDIVATNVILLGSGGGGGRDGGGGGGGRDDDFDGGGPSDGGGDRGGPDNGGGFGDDDIPF